MKVKKIFIIAIPVIISILIVLSLVGYFYLRASLPVKDGEIQVSAISSNIEILFDEKGIPQVWADNEQDAWFGVGWQHAADRLFQMELTRKVAQGRLSEMFGELTLDFDRLQRKIGHHTIAKMDFMNLEDPYKGLLEAYVSGINQWVEQTSALPFEFRLLGIEYEPWTVEDCMAIFSFQTWFSHNLQDNDNFIIALEKKVGRERVEQLFPFYPREAPKTVPQSEAHSGETINTGSKIEGEAGWKQKFYNALFPAGEFPFLLAKASNSWLISGAKSNSGNAIFANDPHLDLSRLPQFWYVIGVHTRDNSLNILGITSPGIPFIAMGHNGDIAWAFTAGGIDVTDEYIERVNPDNPDQYQVGDNYEFFRKREEYIFVDGWENPDTLVVKSTRHGPVLGKEPLTHEVYSWRWVGHDFLPSQSISSVFLLTHASNFEDFRKSVTNFAALNANWMYADRDGNIGYQLGTPIPVRNTSNSHTRFPGWEGQYEWTGYHPLDKTPHAFNPGQGWLASCNNKPDEANLDYPLFGNFGDSRIRRITEILSSQNIFSVEDMKKYQLDVVSTHLRYWKPEAIRILQEMDAELWTKKVENWDGSADRSSEEPALVETWVALLKVYTFGDEFEDLLDKFLNRVINRERNFTKIYFGEDMSWFDDIRTTDRIETRDDIAIKAMQEALKSTEGKIWGDIQTVTMAHPLAVVPVLSTVLSLQKGPFPRTGTTGTLNNSTAFWNYQGEFKSVGGPSWRFILDFNDIDGAQMVLPAGQSGHPLSPHFFDFYKMWERGDYWNVPFTRENVEKRAISKLVLIPSSD